MSLETQITQFKQDWYQQIETLKNSSLTSDACNVIMWRFEDSRDMILMGNRQSKSTMIRCELDPVETALIAVLKNACADYGLKVQELSVRKHEASASKWRSVASIFRSFVDLVTGSNPK
jgi:flagellar assembly factor FliW